MYKITATMKRKIKTSDIVTGSAVGLTVVFVVLRLCKITDWSWWWCLSPLLILLAVALIAFIVFTIIYYRLRK